MLAHQDLGPLSNTDPAEIGICSLPFGLATKSLTLFFPLASFKHQAFVKISTAAEWSKLATRPDQLRKLADGTAPIRGTQRYYDVATALTTDIQDFYDSYEAPGICHDSRGLDGQPTTAFDSMRVWVENGTAPEILPIAFNDTNDTLTSRFLCAYPARAQYSAMCGDPTVARCFFCSQATDPEECR